MIRPEVRTKVAPLHGPIGSSLNIHSKLRRALLLPGHIFMESGIGPPLQPPLKLCDGKRESRTDIGHALKSMPLQSRVKAQAPYSLNGQNLYPWVMTNTTNLWPQRDTYRVDLENYLDRTGKTQQIFCEEVTAYLAKSGGKRESLSLSHLRNCLYRKDKTMSFEILKASSAIFHKSVTNYIDDPGALIAGEDLSEESEDTRFLARTLVKGVTSKDITSEQAIYMAEDVLRALARLRPAPARGPGAEPENPTRGQQNLHADLPSPGPRRTPRPKR